MSAPVSLRSALRPCFGASIARAGKSFIPVTSSKLLQIAGSEAQVELVSNHFPLISLSNSASYIFDVTE